MTARPKFDAYDFAGRLSEKLAGRPLRTVAEEAGVSYVTLSRAAKGWPELSHENFLRLSEWLGDRVRQAA